MRNTSENDRFWDAKTFQNYALCNEFTTFGFSENVGKSMPKGTQKVMVLGTKSTIGRRRVDLYRAFWIDFGRFGKTLIF